MNSSMAHKGFIASGVLLAGVTAFLGAVTLLGTGNQSEATRHTAGLITLAFMAVVVVGLWLHLRWRLPGQIVMMAGAIPPAALWAWTIVTPLLAVMMVALWLWSRRVQA